MDANGDSARSQRARIAALKRHALGDTREATVPARRAFLLRFEQMVDPEGKLSDAERQRRSRRLLCAYMRDLSLKSARARRGGRSNRA